MRKRDYLQLRLDLDSGFLWTVMLGLKRMKLVFTKLKHQQSMRHLSFSILIPWNFRRERGNLKHDTADILRYQKDPKKNVLQSGVTRSNSPKYCQNVSKTVVWYLRICKRMYRIWRIASLVNASEQSQILYVLYYGICGMQHLLAVTFCGWVFSRFFDTKAVGRLRVLLWLSICISKSLMYITNISWQWN